MRATECERCLRPTYPEQAYLLDVREDDEWQAGHAPDAQHIALGLASASYPTGSPATVIPTSYADLACDPRTPPRH